MTISVNTRALGYLKDQAGIESLCEGISRHSARSYVPILMSQTYIFGSRPLVGPVPVAKDFERNLFCNE